MIYFLLFLLGVMIIPVILVIVAIFHPFNIKIKFGDKIGYDIGLGYEVPGVYQCNWWFCITKEYYDQRSGEVEYAYIMYHFWEGARHWQKRNAMEVADLGVEE